MRSLKQCVATPRENPESQAIVPAAETALGADASIGGEAKTSSNAKKTESTSALQRKWK